MLAASFAVLLFDQPAAVVEPAVRDVKRQPEEHRATSHRERRNVVPQARTESTAGPSQ